MRVPPPIMQIIYIIMDDTYLTYGAYSLPYLMCLHRLILIIVHLSYGAYLPPNRLLYNLIFKVGAALIQTFKSANICLKTEAALLLM